MARSRPPRPGFVLPTLLLVVACARKSPDADEARASATTILSAGVEWRRSHPDGCPTTPALASDGALHVDPMLREGRRQNPEEPAIPDVRDPWGAIYGIECDGATLRVRSLGPDGIRGTRDDIVVPAP